MKTVLIVRQRGEVLSVCSSWASLKVQYGTKWDDPGMGLEVEECEFNDKEQHDFEV